jgi:hypothetical protein
MLSETVVTFTRLGAIEMTSDPVGGCGQCNEGWICEEHPEQRMGHEHCGGAGMPCQNPLCEFSTGLVCPKCKRSHGEIEHQTDRVIRFQCLSCRYQWYAEGSNAHEPGTVH